MKVEFERESQDKRGEEGRGGARGGWTRRGGGGSIYHLGKVACPLEGGGCIEKKGGRERASEVGWQRGRNGGRLSADWREREEGRQREGGMEREGGRR